MARIREIGAGELEVFVDVVSQAMPREEMGGVAGLVDWKRQAADMIWLLAEEDDTAAGAGYALTGWHTPPHRAIGAALVVPERRGHGIGDELRSVLERWSAERGITELEGPVAEEDDGGIAWAAARGYEEAGRNSRMVLDLTAIEAPAVEPPPGIEIVTWAERPELAEGPVGGRTRGRTRHPRRGGDRCRRARGVARPRHARRRRPSRCRLRRARG